MARFVSFLLIFQLYLRVFAEGKVVLTKTTSLEVYAYEGETVKFQWNYTADDKNIDFGYYVSSPIWYYYPPNGSKSVIAVDDGLHDWKWTISQSTCPQRLLEPTVRVSKESVATLVITNVTKADTGGYEICLVLRTSPSVTNRVKLTVTDKKARFTKAPSSTLFVAKGKTARFEWNYTYDNRNIEFKPESLTFGYINHNNKWETIATEKKNKTWIMTINRKTCPSRLLHPTRVSTEQPATLVISNVTEADNGVYGFSLRLRNDIPINSTASLIVTDNPKITLPTLTRKVIQEGSDVSITCSAKGSPEPNVTWKISSHENTVTERIGKIAVLRIKQIKRDQSGVYKCQASNNPNEPSVTKGVNIVVIYFKSHESSSLQKDAEVQILEGKDLNITCAWSLVEFGIFTWFHLQPMSNRVQYEKKFIETRWVNNGTLTIRNISRSQQGLYQCQTSTKQDGIVGVANVIISVNYPPEIDNKPSDNIKFSTLGGTVYLRCVARGVPVPNVTWYGLNGMNRATGTSSSLGTSELQLPTIHIMDYGIYRCRANNPYGTVWHNVTVLQSCPCNTTSQKKKKRYAEWLFSSVSGKVLIAVLGASLFINVILFAIIYFRNRKTGKNPLHSRPINYQNEDGYLVLENIYPDELSTANQAESSPAKNIEVNGHYQELVDGSFKVVPSPGEYERLTDRKEKHPKSFNKEQGNYQQLQQAACPPVYQMPCNTHSCDGKSVNI